MSGFRYRLVNRVIVVYVYRVSNTHQLATINKNTM